MKPVSFVRRGALLGLLGLLSLATAVGLLQANTADTFSLYLPITMVAPPPPPPPVPPEHVATFPLLGAGCPANIAYNETSDWFYVTNEGIGYYSVSLLRQRQFDRNLFTGNWPVHVTSDPDSSRVYVSNVLGVNGKGTISLFNADQVIAETLAHHEPYNTVINNTNGYTYVSDLHNRIRILKDAEYITDIQLFNTEGKQIDWHLASTYDPETGLTYFASWQFGLLAVIDGTTLVEQIYFDGTGANDMVFAPQGKYLYIANARAGDTTNEGRPNNISVLNLETREVTRQYTAKKSQYVAYNEKLELAYFTNPNDDTVTVMHQNNVVANVAVGARPWGVMVHPETGYVFVANSNDNTVSILEGTEVIKTISLAVGVNGKDEGYQPWKFVTDTRTNDVYLILRSSRTVYDEYGRPNEKCDQPWVAVFEDPTPQN